MTLEIRSIDPRDLPAAKGTGNDEFEIELGTIEGVAWSFGLGEFSALVEGSQHSAYFFPSEMFEPHAPKGAGEAYIRAVAANLL